MTSLKTSIKTITYLSDIGCLEMEGQDQYLNVTTVVGVNFLYAYKLSIGS